MSTSSRNFVSIFDLLEKSQGILETLGNSWELYSTLGNSIQLLESLRNSKELKEQDFGMVVTSDVIKV